MNDYYMSDVLDVFNYTIIENNSIFINNNDINNLDVIINNNSALPSNLQFTNSTLTFVIVYSVLFFIAAVGNLTVFVSLFKSRHRKSRISLMILHLAIADSMVTFIMIPLEVSFFESLRWKGITFKIIKLSIMYYMFDTNSIRIIWNGNEKLLLLDIYGTQQIDQWSMIILHCYV